MDREATNLQVERFGRKYSDVLGIESELLEFILFSARALFCSRVSRHL